MFGGVAAGIGGAAGAAVAGKKVKPKPMVPIQPAPGPFQRAGAAIDQAGQNAVNNIRSDINAGQQAVNNLNQAAGPLAPALQILAPGLQVGAFAAGAQGNAMNRGVQNFRNLFGF